MGSKDDLYGRNADGSKSEDYCKYCFSKGEFLSNVEMDELIEICVSHIVCSDAGMSEEQARDMLREKFPRLKRWKRS